MDGCIYDGFSPCDHDCDDCPQQHFDRCFCEICGDEISSVQQEATKGFCTDCFVEEKLTDFDTLKEFAQEQLLEFKDFLILEFDLAN
ncbi:MAG: hypothetical protein GX896_09015 [Clostridiales bacterium]|nr:hypothetical protein [Clostridiales bacterium]